MASEPRIPSSNSTIAAAILESRIPINDARKNTPQRKMLCQAWKRTKLLLRNAGKNSSTTAGTKVKYPPAAANRSADASVFIDRPQPGQNPAPAGMGVSQRGQRVSACVELGGLDKAPAIAFLPALFADAVDLKGMSSGYKVMLTSDLLFELSNLRREKFNRRSALGTPCGDDCGGCIGARSARCRRERRPRWPARSQPTA